MFSVNCVYLFHLNFLALSLAIFGVFTYFRKVCEFVTLRVVNIVLKNGVFGYFDGMAWTLGLRSPTPIMAPVATNVSFFSYAQRFSSSKHNNAEKGKN